MGIYVARHCISLYWARVANSRLTRMRGTESIAIVCLKISEIGSSARMISAGSSRSLLFLGISLDSTFTTGNDAGFQHRLLGYLVFYLPFWVGMCQDPTRSRVFHSLPVAYTGIMQTLLVVHREVSFPRNPIKCDITEPGEAGS